MKATSGGPRVLFLDIETKPLMGYVWSIWEQNVGLNQIASDWSIMSFCAKWLGTSEKSAIYHDLRASKDLENDRPLLEKLWPLLDEADIVVTQNGVSFDKKKINARLIMNGFQPPSSYRMIDTKIIAKSVFGFTSNRLEYMTDKLNKKYKKLKHSEFGGFEMWKECMAGNQKAWKAMEKYNRYDVLSLEELYNTLLPWSNKTPNFNVYRDGHGHTCQCGSTEFEKRGHTYTSTGKYQRYRCVECGTWTRDSANLLDVDKRRSLRRPA